MKYILFFLLIIFNFGFSQITTIHSFQEAERDLNNLSKKSLVLFDVDEVLITPDDIVLKPIGASFQPKCLNQKTTKEQYSEILSIMLSSTKYVLVDSTAPDIIQGLIGKNIPTIGLTSCRTGEFGVIRSMESWRIKQLSELNIDFDSSFSKDEHSFFELVDKKALPPLFKKGILFCGDFYDSMKSTKGQLLKSFLDWKNYEPDIVIFFDDEMKNLLVVQEEMKKRNIPFKGFLFKQDTTHLHLDANIAELQFRTALEKKKWLSDQEAQALLSN